MTLVQGQIPERENSGSKTRYCLRRINQTFNKKYTGFFHLNLGKIGNVG